jgi:hypothetical protein
MCGSSGGGGSGGRRPQAPPGVVYESPYSADDPRDKRMRIAIDNVNQARGFESNYGSTLGSGENPDPVQVGPPVTTWAGVRR